MENFGTTGPPLTTDDFIAAAAKMKEFYDNSRRELLRSAGNWKKSKCPRCHRTPVLTNDGFGDTIECCAYVFEKLRKAMESDPSRKLCAPSIGGLRISRYPCDPRPRL